MEHITHYEIRNNTPLSIRLMILIILFCIAQHAYAVNKNKAIDAVMGFYTLIEPHFKFNEEVRETERKKLKDGFTSIRDQEYERLTKEGFVKLLYEIFTKACQERRPPTLKDEEIEISINTATINMQL